MVVYSATPNLPNIFLLCSLCCNFGRQIYMHKICKFSFTFLFWSQHNIIIKSVFSSLSIFSFVHLLCICYLGFIIVYNFICTITIIFDFCSLWKFEVRAMCGMEKDIVKYLKGNSAFSAVYPRKYSKMVNAFLFHLFIYVCCSKIRCFKRKNLTSFFFIFIFNKQLISASANFFLLFSLRIERVKKMLLFPFFT